MSIVIDQNTRTSNPAFASLSHSAANDDHLPRPTASALTSTEATGGWDAYDVWRKLIKEARDRREGHSGESLR